MLIRRCIVMLFAVQFNDEMCLITNEIDNIYANSLLALKFPRAGAEVIIPQMPLVRRHGTSQGFCTTLGNGAIRTGVHDEYLLLLFYCERNDNSSLPLRGRGTAKRWKGYLGAIANEILVVSEQSALQGASKYINELLGDRTLVPAPPLTRSPSPKGRGCCIREVRQRDKQIH